MAIVLVPSDKHTGKHIFSPCLSIVSSEEYVPEVDASLKVLSTYNLMSNTLFL